MRIADYFQDSITDGPGWRFVLFTQGCNHHCEGCHNPGTLDPKGGREVLTEEIITAMLSNPLTDGLTLSGGEPLDQAAECAVIARAAKNAGLNVWCYTGYTFEQLLNPNVSVMSDEWQKGVAELLETIDVLVDGPFILKERSLALAWRGSGNQRILDMKKSLASRGSVLYY